MEMLKILKFYFKSFNINSYITKYDFGILDTQMNLIALSRILNIIFWVKVEIPFVKTCLYMTNFSKTMCNTLLV